MKVFSCDGKQCLCTLPDSTTHEQLASLLTTRFSTLRPPVTQIVGPSHLYAKYLREGSTEDEILQFLQTVLPPEHLVRREGRCANILFLQRVPILSRHVRSWQDVLANVKTLPLVVFQSIFAQIIALVVVAQERIFGFAHNDFKCDNILITSSPNAESVIGSFQVSHRGACVVWVDVETVTSQVTPRPKFPQASKEALEVFGMAEDEEWCSWTDLHLLFMECLYAVQKYPPSWCAVFLDFVNDCVPLAILKTHKDGNTKLLTSMNRLSRQGRVTVNELLASGTMKSPRDVLRHSFFAAVVKETLDTEDAPLPQVASSTNMGGTVTVEIGLDNDAG